MTVANQITAGHPPGHDPAGRTTASMSDTVNEETPQSAADLAAQLQANLDRPEYDWDPQSEGDQVLGTITAIDYVEMKKSGELVPAIQVATPADELVKVWCGRTRLRNQLERLKAQVGDGVGVRYLGQQPGVNGGQDFHDYKVTVIRVGPRIDGQMFQAEPQPDSGLTDKAHSDVWTEPDTTVDTAPASPEEAGF